jgi:ribosomal protein S27AE
MVWNCGSCGTTLTLTAPASVSPGMQKCPRCGKRMERAEAVPDEVE